MSPESYKKLFHKAIMGGLSEQMKMLHLILRMKKNLKT